MWGWQFYHKEQYYNCDGEHNNKFLFLKNDTEMLYRYSPFTNPVSMDPVLCGSLPFAEY